MEVLLVGCYYKDGTGTDKDLEKAIYWHQKKQ